MMKKEKHKTKTDLCHSKKYSLKVLVKKINKQNTHSETFRSKPKGKEVY